ncbi:MAG: hypothetical protein HY717_08240 [Planctomycetes bacterium]|nr:hypothetical protein [Planctomycetota bacterium]
MDLVKVFRTPRVFTFDQLSEKLSLSRSSAFRRLTEHGYFTSYNYSGKFLTLEEVADFDAQGLWIYKAARFSRHGTLKETVAHFVESSDRGMTHEELAGLLGVRAYNVLLELTKEEKIRRKLLGPSFVYFAKKRSLEKGQELRRREFLPESHKPQPSNRQVIATLLEIIKDPRVSREQIVTRCQRSGVLVSRQSVETIFEIYELDKKRAL